MDQSEVATAKTEDGVQTMLKRRHSSVSDSTEEVTAKKMRGPPPEKNALQILNELVPKLDYLATRSGPEHNATFTVAVQIRDQVNTIYAPFVHQNMNQCQAPKVKF
jgi:hypothetical protein